MILDLFMWLSVAIMASAIAVVSFFDGHVWISFLMAFVVMVAGVEMDRIFLINRCQRVRRRS